MTMKTFSRITWVGLFLLGLTCTSSHAQSFKVFPVNNVPTRYEKSNGIVYTLPKTNLRIEIEVEKTQRIKGPFAAEAHLVNLTNVILQNETTYRIKNMKIIEQGLPDETQSYLLIPEGAMNILQLAPNGMIERIAFSGAAFSELKTPPTKTTIPTTFHAAAQESLPSLSTTPIYEKTFLEKGMYANKGNLSATEIAEKIKRIRDYQLDILSGSNEGTYLNTTVDFMYKQMDEIINGYLSLFTGTEKYSEETYSFDIVPERSLIQKTENTIPICTFSEKTGIGPITESTSSPMIYLDLQEPAKRSVLTKNTLLMSDLGNKGAGLVYRVPKLTHATLSYGEKKFSYVVSVAQYGNLHILSGKKFGAVFNPETGSLIHCESK